MIDRPVAVEYPRETDDVNIPLENVLRQTIALSRVYRDRYELSPIVVSKELGRETGLRCAFYRVTSSYEIYDYRFSACDTTPDIFIQLRAFVSLSIKAFNIGTICSRNNYCKLMFQQHWFKYNVLL